MGNNEDIKPDYGMNAREQLKFLGNPNELHGQNQAAILDWLYRWGFSTADILSDLLGRKNRSHAKKLADRGWIRQVSIKGYPVYYTLTERGLAEAVKHHETLLEYKEIDPYRVHLPTLHHNLVAQKETMMALRRGWIFDYRTERMPAADNDKFTKVYDVIWTRERDTRGDWYPESIIWTSFNSNEYPHVFCGYPEVQVGLEIELTPKWNHHLDDFVTKILQDVQGSHLQWIIIVSDSPAILKRYSEAFSPGRKVPFWNKGPGGKLVRSERSLTVPEGIYETVLFRTTNWQDRND